MNLCKDCFYCFQYFANGAPASSIDWKCEIAKNLSPVTGIWSNGLCTIERCSGSCGHEGKNFISRVGREQEMGEDNIEDEDNEDD